MGADLTPWALTARTCALPNSAPHQPRAEHMQVVVFDRFSLTQGIAPSTLAVRLPFCTLDGTEVVEADFTTPESFGGFETRTPRIPGPTCDGWGNRGHA